MSKDAKTEGDKKMKTRKYLKELRKLQGELCKLQEWVKHKRLRVIIVFEAATPLARAARSRPSPNASARACSGWSPCPHRPTVKSRRCTSNVTCSIFRRQAKS